ncbi:GNAT family N-acetyltransferase [Loktanella sp. F6476L]|uniref:GNAT family N-acetyltransferase n=1 Tax=Loktanella sp. F6476L TaxID=2926405 RepID=UPI001FF6E3DE|nr:GNAT family N-acetyltransferase [Loktanella sp. F6476L]MCK0121437.1 GNAT family N-acetyltransferase [Loktanella sp. F6476L]
MDVYAQNGVTPLPVIKTARLELRPMALSDVDAIVPQLNNLDVTRWLSVVPYPYTKEDAIWFIEENLAGRAASWSIFKDDTLIGNVGGGDAHGYWLGQDHWGQGYATEAATAACAHHFATTDDVEITSNYFLGNVGSANVLGKLGFLPTVIGTSHCAATGADVQSQGMVLTRTRWESLHNA